MDLKKHKMTNSKGFRSVLIYGGIFAIIIGFKGNLEFISAMNLRQTIKPMLEFVRTIYIARRRPDHHDPKALSGSENTNCHNSLLLEESIVWEIDFMINVQPTSESSLW